MHATSGASRWPVLFAARVPYEGVIDMKRLRRRGRVSGCTLIEVMVVTSSLASLGSGAFTGAMDAARRDACGQNLRQLGLAVQMFADDNDGKLPAAYFLPADAEKDPGSIERILMPYVKSKPLFICPSAPEAVKKFGLGYIWNDQLNNMLIDQVPNPSQVWMMTDINAAATAVPAQMAQQKKIDLSLIPPAHLEGYNILYADGHVKWSKEPPKIQPVAQQRAQRGQQQQQQQGGDDDQ